VQLQKQQTQPPLLLLLLLLLELGLMLVCGRGVMPQGCT
jgi:hypothetical protein